MFAEFIETYGMEILATIATAIGGIIALAVKNLYKKFVDDQTKKDVVKTVVQGIEQVCKELHGKEKLDAAIESASEMLAIKGIDISKFELTMLIEAAVGEFNEVFHKTEQETAEN